MGFYVSQKDQVLNPSFLFPGFSRSTGRSTVLEVGRSNRSTDVHGRARLCALEGRSTNPVDRQRVSALWKTPVDRAVDRQRELLSVPEAQSTGSVDRSPNGRISDRWRSTGRSTGSSDRPQRLVFLAL